MGYVNAVLIIIGFIIIGYYQKQKIGALEKQIKSQNGIIGSTKAFFDLFDLEKLKGYGDMIEKKVRTEMECQVQGLKGEFNKTVKFLLDEFNKTNRALTKSLLFLPRDQRMTVIDNMEDGITKAVFKEVMKELDRQVKPKDELFTIPPEPPGR